MHKVIEYEVQYDIASEIIYLGEENPGEYYFHINRHWTELTFDDEEDEAMATINDKGEVEVEGYSSIRAEEVSAIGEMMKEIIAKKVAEPGNV